MYSNGTNSPVRRHVAPHKTAYPPPRSSAPGMLTVSERHFAAVVELVAVTGWQARKEAVPPRGAQRHLWRSPNLLRIQFRRVGVRSANSAPVGSASTAIRPAGMSFGSVIVAAPRAAAVSTALSVPTSGSTAK